MEPASVSARKAGGCFSAQPKTIPDQIRPFLAKMSLRLRIQYPPGMAEEAAGKAQPVSPGRIKGGK
jgi:hypothetical protein